MKKILCITGMIAGLLITVILGGLANYKLKSRETVSSFNNKGSKITNWKEPDMESLEYYGLDAFDTKLPVLHIDTADKPIIKESKTWAKLYIMNERSDGKVRNILDTPDDQSNITIGLRGASSYLVFDKEQYRLKFYKKAGETGAKEYSLLGMGPNSEWVLNGPFLDTTLLRNRVIYQISREIFEWAPDSRFCEVFVNGKYQGVYLAVEPVTNGETRLRLNEFGLLSGETAYVVKRDREETESNPLKNYGKIAGKTSNDLYISYPSERKLTQLQRDWIEKDISEFEMVLYGDDFTDPKRGYGKYIDVDNFVDYFILNEVVMNNDAGNLSTYVYKEIGGKLQIAVWDYNNAYDNYQWFHQDYSQFFMKNSAWFHRLLQDRTFVDRIMERYKELRESSLNTGHFYKLIDDEKKGLGGAIDRNFAIWGYVFSENMRSSDGGRDRNPRSYEEGIQQLKSAIDKRFISLDANITKLYEECIN